MARFFLAPFGSAGDVNPCVWLGKLLQARGHDVTLITTPLFQPFAERAGLEFVGVGDEEEYRAVLAHPHLWKPLLGTALVFRLALKVLRPFYEALAQRVQANPDTVLVAPLTLFSARAIREKFGTPLVTMHLQPAAMLSAYDETIYLPGMDWLAHLPPAVKKFLFRLPNPTDWQITRPLRGFCREIGIAGPRRVFPDWLYSPDANLLLFPEWFAPRQPDWPDHATAAGFPMEDLKAHFVMPAGLEEFLAEGDRPILLSPGTGNSQARKFFQVGLAACERLGRRALLGTPYRQQLPDPLPPCARAFDYVPFSHLLPRVAAMVHHGGIGTLSQGFAAGTPQLLMPMGHDQPDNARRARLLGVAEVLTPRDFMPDHVGHALRRLLEDPRVADRCQAVAARMKMESAAEAAVGVLEKMAARAATSLPGG